MTEDNIKAEMALTQMVERGASWLDSMNPLWFMQINIDNLDLRDSERCICGQFFCEDALSAVHEDGYEYLRSTGYEYAMYKYFDGNETEMIRHGFQAVTNYTAKNEDYDDIIYSSVYRTPSSQYHFLGYEWVRQIYIRKVAHGVEI
jgi:hypothetical protein